MKLELKSLDVRMSQAADFRVGGGGGGGGNVDIGDVTDVHVGRKEVERRNVQVL